MITTRKKTERWKTYETIPKVTGDTMIYLIRFRPFSIKDVALARMARPFNGIPPKQSSKQFERLIKPFEYDNYVIDLDPKNELWLIKELVKCHPDNVKPFEHFLVNPPMNMLPSQAYQELHDRSDMIPTLCAVTIIDNTVRDIERINDHHDLFAALHLAHERGWIRTELCEGLLGASRGGKNNVE